MESILYPTLGGVLIGLSSSLLLYAYGRITGVSGIFSSSIFSSFKKEDSWKYFFLLGLIFGGLIVRFLRPELFNYSLSSNYTLIIIGGVIVGFGTRLGSGCTSGHGVCGLPRKSIRSLVATLTFMLFGAITVFIKGLI